MFMLRKVIISMSLILILSITLIVFSQDASAAGLRTAGLILDTDGKILFVKGVVKGSPAEQAGIIKGDTITGYRLGENSKEMTIEQIKPANSFSAIISRNREMGLIIFRGGERKEFTLAPDDIAITPSDMPSGLPVGEVTEVKGSVLKFTVDHPDEVSSEDEFLIFKGNEFICKTKIRMQKGKIQTYGLNLRISEVNELGNAKLIFYNHIVSYYIKKQSGK